jgi:ANTAR domain
MTACATWEVNTSSPNPPSGRAGLLRAAEASAPRSLNQLVANAVRQVPACSGAAAVFWRDSELVFLAASHPSLPELIEAEVRSGRGPTLDALHTGEPVSCSDTLQEDRWPQYATAALRQGVRCSLSLADRSGAAAVCLSLFSARPRMLGPESVVVAQRLVAFGTALVDVASDYGEARRAELQLRDAAESRALVDQAKGVLMHALGCSADEALEQMRQISQARNMRVTEVAGLIIDSRGGDVLEALR